MYEIPVKNPVIQLQVTFYSHVFLMLFCLQICFNLALVTSAKMTPSVHSSCSTVLHFPKILFNYTCVRFKQAQNQAY